jgi:hypothetical protein
MASKLDDMNASDEDLAPYLPWGEVIQKFNTEMAPHYSLDRGRIQDDFMDRVTEASQKVYYGNRIQEIDLLKLNLVAVANSLYQTQLFVDSR